VEVITSVKNPLVAKIKKIKQEPINTIFLDNPKTIEEAYLLGYKIDICLIDIHSKDKILNNFNFLKNLNITYVSSNVLASLSDVKTPQGIACVIDLPKKNISKPKSNFLVLENLQDPGNLGTIIRSSRGTDFSDIYLINCVSPYNQKVVRSTMGALFTQNLYFFKNTQDFINFAKANNLNLCAATMDGTNIYKFKQPTQNFGVVIGNEGNGISKELIDFSQYKVSIPMKNSLESLNAAVACSIMIYYFDNIKNV